MNFYDLPLGFSLALSLNNPAMNAYCAMTETQKDAILEKARRARSEAEMTQIVRSIAQ